MPGGRYKRDLFPRVQILEVREGFILKYSLATFLPALPPSLTRPGASEAVTI